MPITLPIKASELAPGEGRALEFDDNYFALYNDGQTLIVLQNECPHAGCETEWNAADRTWDCPCHGSRFEADGTLKKGPAREPLQRLTAQTIGDQIQVGD